MSLVIFNGSPRAQGKSNTTEIVKAFKKGYEEKSGESAEIYNLSYKKDWETYKAIFNENSNILIAMPLFVECVPGLVMEFIEYLEPKSDVKETKLSFIIQGGFEEACQLRTAEHYLEKVPGYLNCQYAGTLIKGGMFALNILSDKSKEKKLMLFREMGKKFAMEGFFDKADVTQFAAPERYSKAMITVSKAAAPLSKLAWKYITNKLDVTGKLDAKPYEI